MFRLITKLASFLPFFLHFISFLFFFFLSFPYLLPCKASETDVNFSEISIEYGQFYAIVIDKGVRWIILNQMNMEDSFD